MPSLYPLHNTLKVIILCGGEGRRITQQGQLGAYHHDGFWQCMDTSREHRLLNDMWAQGRAPWKVW